MDNIWTQRLQKVEQRDRQTATAIKWLKNNQHLFSQPILEPVCMSVNIRNPCYAKQVEAFFGGRDFFSFVAQNEGDKEKFLREVSFFKLPMLHALPSCMRSCGQNSMGLGNHCT